MKISIDTLPLWDAFRQTDICPFCSLTNRLEELFIETYLGDSVMEPDVRIEVNARGFCRNHYKMLFQQKASKLGLALMTHTHLQEKMKAIEAAMANLDKYCDEGSSLIKRAAGSKELSDVLGATADAAETHVASCVVCERVNTHMGRYHETALYMWEHDGEFKKLFEQNPGLCIPHWGRQLKACKGMLITKKHIEFIRKLNEIEKKSLSELERDIEWFTRKFDYRNTNEPWGNSKTALPRAMNMIEGYIVKPES